MMSQTVAALLTRGHVWQCHGVEVTQTCCGWEHPNARGPHGMHVGGYKSWWVRVDGGEWVNLGSRAGQVRFFEALTVAEALAESTADVLDLMGLAPTAPP